LGEERREGGGLGEGRSEEGEWKRGSELGRMGERKRERE
jgi:hypothetical protein